MAILFGTRELELARVAEDCPTFSCRDSAFTLCSGVVVSRRHHPFNQLLAPSVRKLGAINAEIPVHGVFSPVFRGNRSRR
jgi:hypothetical protein